VEDCAAAAATANRFNCRRLVTKDNECCARCEEPGCLYKGQFYAAGTVSRSAALKPFRCSAIITTENLLHTLEMYR